MQQSAERNYDPCRQWPPVCNISDRVADGQGVGDKIRQSICLVELFLE